MSPFDFPPWDQIAAFDLPVEKFFATPAAHTQLAPSDPTRALLIMSSGGGASFVVSTVASAGATEGIVLTTAAPVLILTCHDFGPLVGVPWYVSASGGGNITVISFSARKWDEPESPGLKHLFDPPPRRPNQRITTAPGVSGGRGILDFWNRLMGRS